MDMYELIRENKDKIIDVRTIEEFQMGNVDGSINIPMHEVPQRIEEFRAMPRPLILICASGNRSGQVAQYLTGLGMKEVYNGGGWMDVLDIVQS